MEKTEGIARGIALAIDDLLDNCAEIKTGQTSAEKKREEKKWRNHPKRARNRVQLKMGFTRMLTWMPSFSKHPAFEFVFRVSDPSGQHLQWSRGHTLIIFWLYCQVLLNYVKACEEESKAVKRSFCQQPWIIWETNVSSMGWLYFAGGLFQYLRNQKPWVQLPHRLPFKADFLIL